MFPHSQMTSKFSPLYTTVINVVFWTLSLIPAAFTIWEVEDRKSYSDSDSAAEDPVANNITDGKKGPAIV